MMAVSAGGNVELKVQRMLYEQQRMGRTDYFVNSKLGTCASAASSGNMRATKFMPDENAIELENGRRVEYEQLVIATGLQYDFDAIEGFYDAWRDLDCPVYAPMDHPDWRIFDFKYTKHVGNFFHGDAYFYIPPRPFRGEVTDYNFLASTAAWDVYKQLGKVHPHASYNVINGNQDYVKYEQNADNFLKNECDKRGINQNFGWRITKIDKDNRTFTSVNDQGEEKVTQFSNLYVIPPCKPRQNLIDAGLAHEGSNNLLDVDPHYLNHNKYANIHGLGDCMNLPTTMSYHAGYYSLHAVANNVFRALKGLPPNYKYDGSTKMPLYLDQGRMTFVTHNYDGPVGQNLFDSSAGFASKLRYLMWAKMRKKSFNAAYMGKNKGPPYGKITPYQNLIPFKKYFVAEEKPKAKTDYKPIKE